MKALISGIKRMETHDGDGIRTTVFFKGCPLKCVWCHNPESISYEKQIALFKEKCINCGICKGEKNEENAKNCPANAMMLYGEEYEVDELAQILLKDDAFFKSSGGGVTLSGGECLSQAGFATEIAKTLHQRGTSVYVDTCGFVAHGVLEGIMPYVDKFLYDIKAITPSVHQKCTGQDNGIILDNLKYLSENNAKIEIRYPLISGLNDDEAKKIGKFLQGLKGITKIKVLQYHSFSASRYDALNMECTLPDCETTFDDVENAVNILKNYGLNAVNGIIDD